MSKENTIFKLLTLLSCNLDKKNMVWSHHKTLLINKVYDHTIDVILSPIISSTCHHLNVSSSLFFFFFAVKWKTTKLQVQMFYM
jgi:hypothetical protein